CGLPRGDNSTVILVKEIFIDLADVGVLGIDYLSASSLRDLSKQHVAFRCWNFPIVLEPIHHLFVRKPHCVLQWTRATRRAYMSGRLNAWMFQPRRRLFDKCPYCQCGGDFNGTHTVAF